VSSKAQASTSASGNPRITRKVSTWRIHSGAWNVGNTVEAISTTSHPTTAYMAATRNTFRRFNSSRRLGFGPSALMR